MRVFGVLLWVVAALFLLAAFGMDTSVPTGTGSRVHNIGLMRAQENAVLIGIGLLIVGAIFIAFGGRKGASTSDSVVDHEQTKKCPFCAETIKKEAVLCRYCGKELPKISPAPVAEDPVVVKLGSMPGRCPNCYKLIPLDSESCVHCKAAFGPESAWKVRPL